MQKASQFWWENMQPFGSLGGGLWGELTNLWVALSTLTKVDVVNLCWLNYVSSALDETQLPFPRRAGLSALPP
jgi:hypothetical protein